MKMLRYVKRKMQNPRVDDIVLSHRMMTRKISRLPVAAKFIFGFSLILSMLLYGSIVYTIFKNDLKDDVFLETDTCPACYGKSYCSVLKNGEISMEGWDRIRLLDFVNVKNVYYGVQGYQKVVLKKLAHDRELAKFDAEMCKSASMKPGCDVSQAAFKAFGFSGYHWILNSVKGVSDMTRCPSQRLIDRIIHKYKEKVDAVDMRSVEKMYLVSTLMVNPEPIMLQAFPIDEGWPFPEYIGACGRFILEQNVGQTLEAYYDAPWLERADYAYQILKIADWFTENPSGFSLYWTDIGYQNLAVSEHGKVVVIDVENIMVVDTWQLKQAKEDGWDEPYYSDYDECESGLGTCLTIPDQMLCTRHTVDHNYYAACRNLLSSYASDVKQPGGLLHHIPEDINTKYKLFDALNACAKPTKPGQRLLVKKELIHILEQIVLGKES